MDANPIGLIVIAVAALGVAFYGGVDPVRLGSGTSSRASARLVLSPGPPGCAEGFKFHH